MHSYRRNYLVYECLLIVRTKDGDKVDNVGGAVVSDELCTAVGL